MIGAPGVGIGSRQARFAVQLRVCASRGHEREIAGMRHHVVPLSFIGHCFGTAECVNLAR
jgi:hypothetical protein